MLEENSFEIIIRVKKSESGYNILVKAVDQKIPISEGFFIIDLPFKGEEKNINLEFLNKSLSEYIYGILYKDKDREP